MKTTPQILGYVMARNEWPLLGAAIIHVLSLGVDKVVVLDHSSNDGSSSELKILQSAFPNRLSILRLDADSYLQEAATAVVGEIVNAQEYDWIYVFDVDEFLLVNKDMELKKILQQIPAHIDIIRYQNDQWIAPEDLNESDLASYLDISHRSIPNLFIDLPGQILADEIEIGNLNYFDIPFPTKVIVRGHLAHTIAPGSHFSRKVNSSNEMNIDPEIFRLAHLPFRSYRALERKSEQGKVLFEGGFPFGHGWQSQLLYRLRSKGLLEDFWRQHSSPKSNKWKDSNSFTSEEDWDLAEVLRRAFDQLEKIKNSTDSKSTVIKPIHAIEESVVPISLSIRLAQRLMVVRDELTQQRDELTQQRDELTQQRDELTQQRDELTQQRDELTQQRDELTQQRDELTQQRDNLLNSSIWRLTKPIRWFVNLLK